MLRLALFAWALSACALSCDVCVGGACQERKTLLRGFAVTDQMAIDRRNQVLYVQLDSDSNTAYDFADLTIERVQKLNTSGLTVDQATQYLYTADYNKTLYRYARGGLLEVASTNVLHEEADLMFYKEVIYYTTKCCRGLYLIRNGTSLSLTYLNNYTITDFVVNKDDRIYFVSDSKVYVYHETWAHAPKVVAERRFVLSVDKFGDVYLGDATVNGIYKLDDSDRMIDYAAYTSGSVDRFVFDHQNNIIFHDPVSDSVAYWKTEGTPCTLDPPHAKFIIKDVPDDLCNQTNIESSGDAFDVRVGQLE